MLCLQYFYNKLYVISFYWFKFEPILRLFFFILTIIISNNLSFNIYYKNIVKMLWIYHSSKDDCGLKQCNVVV